jgi:hypothetical protein
MVPPYLALGEMNRRKQMEKRAAEPPKSTVKDELEQQVQPPAMMPNQAMMQPPMEEMATEDHAYGGITGLPSRFQFDGGGIVSFADGSKDAVKEFDEEGLPLSKSSSILSRAVSFPLALCFSIDFFPPPNLIWSANLFRSLITSFIASSFLLNSKFVFAIHRKFEA